MSGVPTSSVPPDAVKFPGQLGGLDPLTRLAAAAERFAAAWERIAAAVESLNDRPKDQP